MKIVCGIYKDSRGWFRILGWGIAFKDLRRHELLFSERNGYTKTLKLFNWSFKILKP